MNIFERIFMMSLAISTPHRECQIEASELTDCGMSSERVSLVNTPNSIPAVISFYGGVRWFLLITSSRGESRAVRHLPNNQIHGRNRQYLPLCLS